MGQRSWVWIWVSLGDAWVTSEDQKNQNIDDMTLLENICPTTYQWQHNMLPS